MSVFPHVAFLTGSVGTGEWIVLFVVVLIVVGPKRLPEIARKIGRTMEMFRRAADEFKDQLMSMDQEPPAAPSATPAASGEGAADGAGAAGDYADPYSDAYPNLADYPGNEEHVENWAAEALAGQEPSETGAAPAAPEADAPDGTAAAAEKPAGDGA